MIAQPVKIVNPLRAPKGSYPWALIADAMDDRLTCSGDSVLAFLTWGQEGFGSTPTRNLRMLTRAPIIATDR